MARRQCFNLYLNPVERDILQAWCLKMKRASSAQGILMHSKMSTTLVSKEIPAFLERHPYPPLEEVWNLHFCQIIPIESYVLNLEAEKLNQFKEAVCELCLHDSMGDKSKEFVQTGMMSYFVDNCFQDDSLDIKKVSESILKDVLQGLFLLEKEDVGKSFRTFHSLWNCGTLEENTLIKFSVYALSQFTETSPAEVIDSFSIQENCYNNDDPFHLEVVIQKILQGLDSNKVEHFLFDVSWDSAANWKNFLVVVHAFLRTYSEAYSILSKHIVECLKKSLQTLNESTFQKTILIGRQSILALNPANFYPAAYKQWILVQFNECQLLKNPQTFNVFLQFLSNLIPHEKNVEILKVGLERLFPVAAESQTAYADYKALLKTRINDLEPRVQPQDVIERLLVAFEETGKIPSYVLEASLMRKHYFLNEFLPVLLTPRVIPTFGDSRAKFIEELNKAGKIPGQILVNYKALCSQEKQRFFPGRE